MKKYLIILFLFVSAHSFGQSWQVNHMEPGFQFNGIKILKSLLIPTVCGVPSIAPVRGNGQSAIAADTCNNRFYFYNPKDSTWSEAGISRSTIDSILGGYYTISQVDSIVAGFSSIDSTAYHTIGQASDSSYFTINTPDGRIDTVRFVGESDSAGAASRFGIEDNTGVQDREMTLGTGNTLVIKLDSSGYYKFILGFSQNLGDRKSFETIFQNPLSNTFTDLQQDTTELYFNYNTDTVSNSISTSNYGIDFYSASQTGNSSNGTVREMLITPHQSTITRGGGINDDLPHEIATSVNGSLADSTGNIQLSQLKVTTKSSDPTTTDIPDGYSAVYKNSTSGNVYLWVNISGTLLKTQLN
ncbi:MAG TPA: hypothetical protein VN726_22865 [Hanamia sp.]|nr:hypothetical protein [Hanamia sp.]